MAKNANNVVLPPDGSVEAAIKRVQRAVEDSYVVIGYADKSRLEVVAEGAGGLDATRDHFIPKDARYFYFRKGHQVEMAQTVKFAFVDWTPDSIPPLRRALLSTHKGQINEIFKPAHVHFQWSEQKDIDERVILERIGFASGTASHVTEEKGPVVEGGVQKSAEYKKPVAKGPDLVPSSIKESVTLHFVDEDAVRNAIKAVRSDADPTNWLVVNYSGVDTLQLAARGEGGLDELLAALEDTPSYAFFRITERFDQSETVKFGFVKIMPKSTKPTLKAKISTHRGFLVSVFQPYHAEFEVDSKSDLSPESITERFGKQSGVRSSVVSAEYRESVVAHQKEAKDKRAAEAAYIPVVSQESLSIVFEDEGGFRGAIAAVRSDADPANWALAVLEGKNKLKLVASGASEDPVSAVKAAIDNQEVHYGLVRLEDVIDGSARIKFVYIKMTPRNIAPSKKATLPGLKGSIDPLFQPFHTDVFIETSDELDPEQVVDKVKSVGGSKSHVLPSDPVEG